MKKISGIVLVAAIVFSAPLCASAADEHHAHHGADTAVATRMADGEIRKVDREAGKITIKHGPIANLDMPAMTMAFRVKDAVLLDQLKSGDKVRFVANRINGAYVVMRIEPVK
ncbi:MAG TPA: copper-binding protein [Burkholderiaceae bacterium]|nr:copper-binding protein [Burkholderiaceae bacterium]